MKRSLLTITAALLLIPPPVACQTGRGTVIVVDRSQLTVEVTPSTYTGEVGDTVTFSAVAIDSISGDTIPSTFTWTSLDSSGVSIEPTTGLATLLQAGTYEVEALIETIVSMNGGGLSSSPDRVTTLTVVDSTATSFRLAWIQVDDGTGQPANYEVRVREAGDTISWLHPSLVVLDGSCAFPVLGQAIGEDVVCDIINLDPETDYQAVVRAFRDEDPAGG